MAKNKAASRSHQLRIIAGKWRGQKIKVIDQDDLRPTTDRVRETLFNWLALPIVNAQCLDAFAGSGILSFESLSREAKSVISIEKSRLAVHALKKNKERLDASQLELIEQDSTDFLKQTPLQFDIIFLDPPFAQPKLIINSLEVIKNRQLMKKNGLIYIEMAKQDLHMMESLRHSFVWLKEKMAGQVCYALLSLNQ